MVNVQKNLYRDYEELLIKNDKLSEENRNLRYTQALLESQNKTLRESEIKVKEKLVDKDNIIKQQ